MLKIPQNYLEMSMVEPVFLNIVAGSFRIILRKINILVLGLSKVTTFRSSSSQVLLGKGVLKICSKFTGEHRCRSEISIKLLCNFIEIELWHGCFPVNLLHFFRTPFPKNTSGGMLMQKHHKSLFRTLPSIYERF